MGLDFFFATLAIFFYISFSLEISFSLPRSFFVPHFLSYSHFSCRSVPFHAALENLLCSFSASSSSSRTYRNRPSRYALRERKIQPYFSLTNIPGGSNRFGRFIRKRRECDTLTGGVSSFLFAEEYRLKYYWRDDWCIKKEKKYKRDFQTFSGKIGTACIVAGKQLKESKKYENGFTVGVLDEEVVKIEAHVH